MLSVIYADCKKQTHYAEYRFMLNVIMLSVIMLSVTMLSVIMLSVVAPSIRNVLFSLQLTNGPNKLECFSLAILSSQV